jgi:ureidoacrylate peracid hydrolase
MRDPIPLPDKVDPAQSAVLVVDYQNDFVAPGGALDRAGMLNPSLAAVEGRITELIDRGRRAGCKVVFLRCEYNSQPVEKYLSDVWLDQAARRWHGLYIDYPVCVAGTWGSEFYGRVQPDESDIVVTKHRFGGFEGTDLDMVLRANGIRTLIFGGVVTHVCVESTIRQAFFRDFFSVVVSDSVAGWQPDWHRTSLQVLDWGFAEVVTAGRLFEAWESGAAAAPAPDTAGRRPA